jgi:hypothetical protein
MVLNVRTHATIPDIPGLAAAAPLTNIEALGLDRVLNHGDQLSSLYGTTEIEPGGVEHEALPTAATSV